MPIDRPIQLEDKVWWWERRGKDSVSRRGTIKSIHERVALVELANDPRGRSIYVARELLRIDDRAPEMVTS